ncbi:MAG TPA: hypothetical protein P5065_05230 [Candidatus Ratteibacteria bacterium]|nr:hypothetical protein [Candidatus Ratteibacteria bacterium]HRV04662.1 hypothetical protein [Candidatus Ratteibacteria bacterium]
MSNQEFFVSVAVDIPVRTLFTYKTEFFVQPGQRVLVPFGNRKLVGWIIGYAEDKGTYDYKKILKVYDDYSLIPEYLIDLAREISDMCFCSIGSVLSAFSGKFSKNKINYNIPASQQFNTPENEGKPTVHRILKSISDTGKKIALVRFYDIKDKMNFFQDISESINGSIVFIFSTVIQAEKVFSALQNVYGERVLYFSSEYGKKEKTLCWLRMLKGKNLIIIGTRTALFSPVSDIKMLIVDEPTEYGHKQRQSPKYNSREIALKISEMRNIPVLFTTLQPDVTDVFLCKTGKSIAFESTISSEFPRVIISKLEKNWQSSILTDISKHLLEKTLVQGKKVILIHNIKGYARIILCKKCGASIVCQECGGVLTPVSEDYAFCGTDKRFFKIPSKCPVCKKRNLSIRQPGIKKIVDTLRNIYPGFTISVASENQPVEGLSQIIVGTQHLISYIVDIMPGLLIFINADMIAARTAFRSEERFFLIVEKIKKMMPGNENFIVIQTGNPGIDVYGDLSRNDEEMFYKRELSIREQLKFPPFGELISIQFSGRNWLKNKDSILEELKKSGDIYESEIKKKATEVLWKVQERKTSFKILQMILEKYRITNFTVDPTPYF